MKLQLYITKRETKHYNTRVKTKHLFAVIDLDKSKQYPQNFVSVLPKKINAKVKPANIFEEIFGDKSLELANQLLQKALKKRPDPETAKAIRDRIKLLDPQPHYTTKCEKCGKPIKQSKRKYKLYKFCFSCHSKRYIKN